MKIKSKVRGGPRGCGGGTPQLPNVQIPLRSNAPCGLTFRGFLGSAQACEGGNASGVGEGEAGGSAAFWAAPFSASGGAIRRLAGAPRSARLVEWFFDN